MRFQIQIRGGKACTDEPLFPPSSSRTLPNLDWTFLPTILPTFSLPVKETGCGAEFSLLRLLSRVGMSATANHSPMSTSWLWTTASPTSLPPVTRPATAPGTSFFSRTPETILVTAMEQSGVVGEGFQIVALPAAIEIARFLHFTRTSIQFFRVLLIQQGSINTSHILQQGS